MYWKLPQNWAKISLDKTENGNFQTLSSNDCQTIFFCFKSHMLTTFGLKIDFPGLIDKKVDMTKASCVWFLLEIISG